MRGVDLAPGHLTAAVRGEVRKRRGHSQRHPRRSRSRTGDEMGYVECSPDDPRTAAHLESENPDSHTERDAGDMAHLPHRRLGEITVEYGNSRRWQNSAAEERSGAVGRLSGRELAHGSSTGRPLRVAATRKRGRPDGHERCGAALPAALQNAQRHRPRCRHSGRGRRTPTSPQPPATSRHSDRDLRA